MALWPNEVKMTTTSNDGVILQPVESTSLYQPAQPAPGENMLFLLWDAGAHPATIPLENTWAASGPPVSVGYFLFLNVLPAAGTFAAFEQTIRKLLIAALEPLTALVTSGFAWVVYDLKTQTPTIQTLLKTKLDNSQHPVVDGDTELVLLRGQKRVGFSDGTPLFATAPRGSITDFVSTYPVLAGAQTPQQTGVALPMTGGLVGCVRFAGLVNLPNLREDASSARKTLVDVAIDPLHPLDTKRNFKRFTGNNFILTQDGNTYSISRTS